MAPALVGVSVAFREQGVTFTLVATSDEIAALDGVQYLQSGPCVDALDAEQGLATDAQDLFSEPRWLALAQASAAAGVRSTLTFPIMLAGEVIGTVNLYGGTADAFAGKHEALATVFGGWAPMAVTNADLSFSTRRAAQDAPTRLRRNALVDAATGLLAARHDITTEEARQRLQDAAIGAGTSPDKLAESILRMRDYAS